MMTSRQRIEEAINFRKTDRVPVDLGGMKASGITVGAYTRLKEYLGLTSETRIWDPRFMIAVVEEEIRKRFHVDVLPLDLDSAVWWAKKEKWIPKKLFDGQTVLFPPRTKIKEETDAWTLLNPDGSRHPIACLRMDFILMTPLLTKKPRNSIRKISTRSIPFPMKI